MKTDDMMTLEDRVKRLEDNLEIVTSTLNRQLAIVDSVHVIALSLEKQTMELKRQGSDIISLTKEVKDIKRSRFKFSYIPMILGTALITMIVTLIISGRFPPSF